MPDPEPRLALAAAMGPLSAITYERLLLIALVQAYDGDDEDVFEDVLAAARYQLGLPLKDGPRA